VSENKKYYWLKLKRDFFKRHDIRIIESLDNLKEILDSIDLAVLESAAGSYETNRFLF
jgi:hypothetical protein